ncbi:hypothetical protein OOU_Y34scaffold00610g24 [Pyricularia oryzae Y34]|uniref:Uncharacterized protein n=2 Tax=Pyricularia oryzae TaxID=318829 RepID=A0AA97PJQ9_PYRO3|nr:hypothetical protein OOU_Y34scaffold00610g24 [Pyricularia oryzae Y34]
MKRQRRQQLELGGVPTRPSGEQPSPQ